LIVIDPSVLANVVGDDGSDGQRARAEFRGVGDVAAPDLVDLETVAVLRKRWLAGTVTERRFAAAAEDLVQLHLDRYPRSGSCAALMSFARMSRHMTPPMWHSPRNWIVSC
jgi:predicted nucleic acid-binding protein